MLLGIVMIGPVGAQSATIGVEPSSKIDPLLGPGSTFTVEIWVRNVANLAGVEFKLGYATAVLTATEIEYGGIFGETFMIWMNETYDDAGYLHLGISEWFGEPAFTGDGRVAIIHFTADSVGESVLNLYGTILGDASVPPEPMSHEILDGYFSNEIPPTLPSVVFAKRRAWPEHNDYHIYKDEDSSNDLFAIVYNDGTVDTVVKVVFTVTDKNGVPIAEIETPAISLPVGAMYGDTKPNRLKVAFVPPAVGKYYVSARCFADTDGDDIPEFPMLEIETFSFTVKVRK